MQTIEALGKYTFQALLNNSKKLFGNRPALSFVSGDPITYEQLVKNVEMLKEMLNGLGIKKGNKIAIFAPSSPFWGIVYFAVVTMGAIAVPLLPDFNKDEVASCIAHADVKAIFVNDKLLPKLNRDVFDIIINAEDFSLIKGEKCCFEPLPVIECKEEDTASIIYTSGTTGRPKGVELTNKNILFTAINGQYAQRINKYDTLVSILPMAHVYAFTIGFVMFMLNGACVYYLEGPPTPRLLLDALQKVRPNFMLSVPIVIEKIYKQKILPSLTATPLMKKIYETYLGRKILSRIAGYKLKKTFGGRIKFFGIGGAKVDPIVERFMKDAKFPYAIGYGLTETSPLVAYAPVKGNKVGWLKDKMYGIEIKVGDPDPETGIGELLVKGENVMKGYYNDPVLTAAAFTEDGWLKTGDLCLITKKGRIMLKGRSKNMILGSNGENIYPEDIEFVLNQHPLVTESLVVEGDNSAIVAFVQIDAEKLNNNEKNTAQANPETKPTSIESIQNIVTEISNAFVYKREEMLNEIKFFVNSKVNKISRIERIEFVEKFEKSASQKIKRYLYSGKNKFAETKAAKNPEVDAACL